MRKNSLVILGMMTGTSCDGLDAVTVSFSGDRFKILSSSSLPYPKRLRERALLFQAPDVKKTSADWLSLQRELGRWYANSAKKLLRSSLVEVDVIANHGQTLAHLPPIGTLQMGDPAYMANLTGLTVVSQFRTGDLAAGGEGAPLVPRFHQILTQTQLQKGSGLAVHNLGGISNLTYLRRGYDPIAWDTGPANLWLDLVISQRTNGKHPFDKGGRLARKGKPHLPSVEDLLRHPYFKRLPPKSTGRDEFTESHLKENLRPLSLESALATVTLATAKSIVREYQRQILNSGRPLSAIYFCGGGAKNTTLLECLQVEFQEIGWSIPLKTTSELGVGPQQMEAAAFAFLAKESLLGRPLGGSWTGATQFGTPGQISPGKNWQEVLMKLARLSLS